MDKYKAFTFTRAYLFLCWGLLINWDLKAYLVRVLKIPGFQNKNRNSFEMDKNTNSLFFSHEENLFAEVFFEKALKEFRKF